MLISRLFQAGSHSFFFMLTLSLMLLLLHKWEPGLSCRKYTLFQSGRHFSILLFPCKLALVASFKVKFLLNSSFESEAIRANLHGKRRILKWRPFWNRVYEMQEFLSIYSE